MTHCNNCGHSGTFVLLAQLALAVPGPTADDASAAADSGVNGDADRPLSSSGERSSSDDVASAGDCSLAVQCPACDSTDVAVAASDLLARYGSSTTS
ncbi:hypothetical protein [Halorussus pelagicus]|uniref:hypothetical protein n=1 Tax=Halorussus pelagicus TaxID=2505977 RepID=UPI000FFB6E34|nr:hypothetical protein [Halorussus pelagicus]